MSNLQDIINTPAGKELRELLISERAEMNRIPETLNPFLFIGSLLELIACQKAIKKIDNLLIKIGITKEVVKKDPRDRYE